jgi:hypothetical protein
VLPLGFRFDADAVIVGGVAHCSDCRLLLAPLQPELTVIAASGVYRSARCPRACPRCRPTFETLLSYELGRPTADVVS